MEDVQVDHADLETDRNLKSLPLLAADEFLPPVFQERDRASAEERAAG